ncbi:MAG: uracil-DNA glycosylase [Chloroflexota bacterium]|nr:uracil-DNA glycosylase [Chloroflexota bacterium]MDE2885085.1 uracil-DNA glycosylase [Chloroflexota bacterium]
MGLAEDFVDRLRGLAFEDAFNPYTDTDPTHDVDGAPGKRRENLLAVIESASAQRVDDMWVGLAPGHKGARRTGLAFTDDFTLERHGNRWGVRVERPTHGKLISEDSASAVWEALDGIEGKVFFWNVFPMHPHEPGDPLSNRSYVRSAERDRGKGLLGELIVELKPQRLIGVGNVAHDVMKKMDIGVELHKVRHPSHGGKPEFLSQIRRLYRQG